MLTLFEIYAAQLLFAVAAIGLTVWVLRLPEKPPNKHRCRRRSRQRDPE